MENKQDIKFMTMFNIAVPVEESGAEWGGAEMYFVRGSRQDAINLFHESLVDREFGDIIDPETGEVLLKEKETDVSKIEEFANSNMFEEEWMLKGAPDNYSNYGDFNYLYSMEDTIGLNGEKYKGKGEGNWLVESRLQEWIPSFEGGEFDGYAYVIAFEWYSRTAYEIVRDHLVGSKRNVETLGKELYEKYDIIAQEVKQGKPFRIPAVATRGWN